MRLRFDYLTAGLALAIAAGALAASSTAPAAPERTTAATQAEQHLARARAQARAQRARADHLQQLLTHRVKEARSLRAQLLHQPSSVEAIRLAAISSSTSPAEQQAMYRTLYALAACETTGTVPAPWPPTERVLNHRAQNPRGERATGLLQFIGSTWRTTPYAAVSIWSPYAQALAGAYMVKTGRLREWSCSWAVRP